MATLRAVTIASAQASRQPCLRSSSFSGKNVVLLSQKVAQKMSFRLVVEAKQNDLQSRSVQAVKNVIGEDASRKIQHLTFVLANAMIAMPAFAEEEKGKIFDFNLTLPIIVIQFLVLMVGLDNIWFKPVSKVMDERDENIRKKLMGVRDNSGEIKALQAEAEAVIRAARVETAAALSKMKKETAAELDQKLQAVRSRIEKELADSIANLNEQKQATLKNLDAQVQALSDEIVQKVIPFKAS